MIADQYVRLQGSYAFYAVDSNTVEIASIAAQRRWLVSGPDAGKTVAALKVVAVGVPDKDAADSMHSASGLRREHCTRILDVLRVSGALVTRSPNSDLMFKNGNTLYDRQLRFLRQYETDEFTAQDLNERLQDRKVLIVGIGGVGGWIALLCSRLGIRKIVAVDPDRVEESNLHRQVLYKRGDIGRPKIEAAAEALLGIDKEVSFEGHSVWIRSGADLVPMLDGVDLIFNPFAYVPSLSPVAEAICDASSERRVPSLAISVVMVGPLTVPGRTASYRSAFQYLNEMHSIDRVANASTPSASREEFWPWLPALAPRQAMAASVAVWEATRFLSGMDVARTLEGIISLDTVSWSEHKFIRLPELNSPSDE